MWVRAVPPFAGQGIKRAVRAAKGLGVATAKDGAFAALGKRQHAFDWAAGPLGDVGADLDFGFTGGECRLDGGKTIHTHPRAMGA